MQKILVLENSSGYRGYYWTIPLTRNEPPPGFPSGAAELSYRGLGRNPINSILFDLIVTHLFREEQKKSKCSLLTGLFREKSIWISPGNFRRAGAGIKKIASALAAVPAGPYGLDYPVPQKPPMRQSSVTTDLNKNMFLLDNVNNI